MRKHRTDPLDPDEIAEVRAMIEARRMWRAFWAFLALWADRLKVLGVLGPWGLVVAYLVAGERLWELLGW